MVEKVYSVAECGRIFHGTVQFRVPKPIEQKMNFTLTIEISERRSWNLLKRKDCHKSGKCINFTNKKHPSTLFNITRMAQSSYSEKLQALLETEAKKTNSRRILLGVQTKDKRVDFRQVAGTDKAISPNNPYFIASQTKVFTSTLIFQLVDEGRVGLADPVSILLPQEMIRNIHVYNGKDYSSNITVEQLLHQTSGLPDYFLDKSKTIPKSLLDEIIEGNDTEWTIADVLSRSRDLVPKFEPSNKSGKRSHYSDTNYQLLGAIIEAVTGTTLKDNFESRIFRPLGLSENTYLYDYKETLSSSGGTKQYPMLFYYKDKELNIPKTMASFGPDGGIVSTMDDMLVFLRAYFDGTLFDKAHHDRIQTQWNTVFVPPLFYGLGLMRFKIPKWMTLYCFDCPALLGHSGANASFGFYAPDQEVFIVGSFNQLDQESRPFPFMLQVLECLK